MAPKKKEKEIPASTVEPVEEEKPALDKGDNSEEGPLMSRIPVAFRRNAQIYRLLGERHSSNPLFLYRCLTYMRKRMSRKRRKDFRVDSLLQIKKPKDVRLKEKYLTITYLGYYDEAYPEGGTVKVRVETSITKKCYNRRKDNAPIVKVFLEPSEVPVNPRPDDDIKVPIISIFPETINSKNSVVKSRTLTIRVMREVNGNLQDFEVTYQLYNSRGQIILSDGCYDASPGYQSGIWLRLQGPAKEAIKDSSVKPPNIYFKVEWTADCRSGWVDRPREGQLGNIAAPTTSAELSENKENRPAKRKQPGPVRSSRPIRTCSTTTTTNNTSTTTSETETNMEVNSVENADAASSQSVALYNGNPVKVDYNFQLSGNTILTHQDVTCRCPWCELNCIELYSLFKHLKLCHERFVFHISQTNENLFKIDISINKRVDRSYEGNPFGIVNRNFDGIPRMRSTFTGIYAYKPKRSKMSLAEFLEEDSANIDVHRTFVAGHNRIYYHTTTCLPMHPREMDKDPEAEKDPKWLRQKTVNMIDDFTDVNEGEKEIIKLWNLHVLKYGYVGDCQIKMACQQFIETHRPDVLDKNLFGNFVLHVGSLFDFGLIGSLDAYNILKYIKEGKTLIDAQNKIGNGNGIGEGKNGGKTPLDLLLNEGQACSSNDTSGSVADGTLRRKVSLQGAKRGPKPVSKIRTSLDSQSDSIVSSAASQDRSLRKRKLSLEEVMNEEPAKRTRCGSDPLESAASASKSNGKLSGLPDRRKSIPATDAPKQVMRKSSIDP